ncbi:hypothetical protein WALSEDRAFT_60263 [Wallemia mellicola CBS 633.66]|nr:hypothetical protein WALSEDRAFT_60263 [Wallemia mellicola CBS 633.66]EIM21832.1 hypothetical protein WALSEDRAFT_60263 [Wallemia mellicola CBS 633.66]|eukprot:XP_006958134.1 hypothetical protein WALSEDRAFT_60263 [Wallemia mellicola CBS 633.66]
MTKVARELYAENNRLRALVQSLSTFIGKGAGSSLSGLGLSQSQIDNLNSYSQVDQEVDLGFEMYMQNRTKENEASIGSKRPRYSLSNHSQSSASPSNHPHPGLNIPNGNNELAFNLQNLLNENLSSSTKPPSVNALPTGTDTPPADFQSECLSLVNNQGSKFNKVPGEESTIFSFANSLKHYSSSKMVQAAQLIEYNLNNFRADQSYHLPPSLKPTITQRTVPHDNLIDGIIFSNLRDKLILQESKVDLRRFMRILLTNTIIHGEDVLNWENWELGEEFCQNYWFLMDAQMLNVTNKWRNERGESLLQRPADFVEEVNDLSPL